MKLLKFIFDFLGNVVEAKVIKSDEEKRINYKKYGILSIVFGLISVLLSFGVQLILLETSLIIFTIVIGLTCAIMTIYFLFKALFYAILQLYINRKTLSWVSIIIFLISLIAVFLVIMFTMK